MAASFPKDPNPTWDVRLLPAGHWDGDTLVVDTAGFNDRSWLSTSKGTRTAKPLHIIERFHRRDFGHMDLQMTIDDPESGWLYQTIYF